MENILPGLIIGVAVAISGAFVSHILSVAERRSDGSARTTGSEIQESTNGCFGTVMSV
jgi:hypothetical protein